MLTGLKLSCLASKIVLYRLEHYAKVPIELLRNKINIPTDRAQRVEKKLLCLAIMYNLGVMVIKMSKSVHFLDFLLMTVQISHSLGKIFKCM